MLRTTSIDRVADHERPGAVGRVGARAHLSFLVEFVLFCIEEIRVQRAVHVCVVVLRAVRGSGSGRTAAATATATASASATATGTSTGAVTAAGLGAFLCRSDALVDGEPQQHAAAARRCQQPPVQSMPMRTCTR